jgi:hypothetical protein
VRRELDHEAHRVDEPSEEDVARGPANITHIEHLGGRSPLHQGNEEALSGVSGVACTSPGQRLGSKTNERPCGAVGAHLDKYHWRGRGTVARNEHPKTNARQTNETKSFFGFGKHGRPVLAYVA